MQKQTATDELNSGPSDEWQATLFKAKDLDTLQITTMSTDNSNLALSTSQEDPLQTPGASPYHPATPSGQDPSDIPGRRARLLAVGTDGGKIFLWNMRQGHLTDGVLPLRIIDTESPQITCLALSSLYLVHGGSDGLVQAWDPLTSTVEPIRTLNSRSLARLPRQAMAVNPVMRNSTYTAVGAIFLDPDATALQGIVAFGTFVRYWSYSSSGQVSGRKRRLRHSDIHSRAMGRRHGGGVKGYIAAEAEELREEQELRAREQARLQSRFGVGLANLTEEEALQYAEMMSQESLLLDEHRRASASDTGSAADPDTTSTTGSLDTATPEPSITGRTPPVASSSKAVPNSEEDDYELRIQTALRLSLLEGVNDSGQSPKDHSSTDFEFPVIYKEKKVRGTSAPWCRISNPDTTHTPTRGVDMDSPLPGSVAGGAGNDEDEDLQLALRLSLAEEESLQSSMATTTVVEDDFPPLEGVVWGKGKGRAF